MNRVLFPAMRREVLRAVAALSDLSYQREAWVAHRFPPGIEFDSLDHVVSTLYDDTEVFRDPASRVGSILLPGPELDRIRELAAALDQVLNRHPTYDTEAVLADNAWPNVLECATRAMQAMVLSGAMSDG